MTGQQWVIVGLAAVLLLVSSYAVVLRRRLHRLCVGRDETPPSAPAPAPVPAERDVDYVITTVGAGEPLTPTVPDQVVLSATLGEPLVKVVAFTHGLRRALSPASRNRIGFEVRQEVRRSRKVRRAEMRSAWREMKARERDERVRQQRETTTESVEGAA